MGIGEEESLFRSVGAGKLSVFQWTIYPHAHVGSHGLKSIVFQETVEDRNLGGRCDIGS